MKKNSNISRGARFAAALLTSLVLAACGGGGGDDPIAAPVAPVAPVPEPVAPLPAPADGSTRITTPTAALTANSRYTITNSTGQPTVLTLPADSAIAVNDTIKVTGNAGSYRIAQNAGQTVSTRTLAPITGTTDIWLPQQGTTTPENWWYLASSADGRRLVGVANAFPSLRFPTAPATGAIWISADAGATWTIQAGPPADANWAGVASSADGTVLAAAASGGQIWVSTNSGATWASRSITPPGGAEPAGFWVSISMSSTGADMAAVRIGGTIWTSTDTGATWIERPSSTVQEWRSIASSADGQKLVAAAYAETPPATPGSPPPARPQVAMYTSTNAGQTWTASTQVFNSAYRVTSSADGNKLAMAERFGGIWTLDSPSTTWVLRGSGTQAYNSIRSSSDGATLIALTPQASPRASGDVAQGTPDGLVRVSTDSGATWTTRPNAGTALWRGAAISGDGNWLFAAQNNGLIYRSAVKQTAIGVAGTITGAATNEVTLRYAGNGRFVTTTATGPAWVTQ